MTITEMTRAGSGTFPVPVRDDDTRFVGLAAMIGEVAADWLRRWTT